MRKDQIRTFVWLVLAFLAMGSIGFAYGGFYNSIAEGTVVPTPATAQLTCYPVDSGYQFAGANSTRSDILATFIKRDSAGRDVGVCFLRPVLFNGGEWTPEPQTLPAPTPVPPSPPPPSPTCPSGFVVSIFGGCVPPNHPDAPR